MKKSRYVIAAVVKGSVSDNHNKMVEFVTDEFGLKEVDTPTHITFKDSFYLEGLSEVSVAVEEVVRAIDIKCMVTIGGLGGFDNRVVYEDVIADVGTMKLLQSLLDRLGEIDGLDWDQFDTIDRHFHMSITTKADMGNYDEIFSSLGRYLTEKREYELDNLSILKKEESGKWVVVMEFFIDSISSQNPQSF